ncbi:hypothetical protein WS62_09290 [Burkholderia sp. ABCPW 14]|nr:hypothetical protein WS62_09290 [Burkholderia sp. ABCPW 14]
MRIYERCLSLDETRFILANYGKRATEWPQLMADVRDAIDAGAPPASPECRALAQRAGSRRSAATRATIRQRSRNSGTR